MPTRLNSRFSARRAANTSQSDRITRISAISAAAIGLAMASASSPPVATSSPVDTTTLEKGSGLAFTSVRAPALPAWARKAAPPPSRKLATCQVGIAGIDDRKAEQGAAERPDERVDRVPGAVDPGDLVGEEFGERADARDADDPVVGENVERAKLVGKRDPADISSRARWRRRRDRAASRRAG